MTVVDRISAPDLALVTGGRAIAGEDLEEAEELIADLAALVDAGLVVVRRQLGGPVRYGPGAGATRRPVADGNDEGTGG